MASGLILLASLFYLIAAMVASAMLNNYWIIALAGVVWLVCLFAWSYLTSVAGHVYRGALYLYAAEGVIPAPYNQECSIWPGN